jgi:flagellar hook-basal body complex protein FliE
MNFKDYLVEKKEPLNEADEAAKAEESIKWLVENDWGKDNETQGKASQLFKALSFNNSKEANDFMDKVNKFTSTIK